LQSLFTLAEKPGCKIFNRLTKQTYQEIRKICIDAILHTDTAFHFKMIKEVQMIYEMNSEIFDSCLIEDWPSEDALVCFRAPESRKLLVKLFLHVADLSNPMKPFRICRLWAYQVQEEFFLQGDKEKSLGIPVHALNDRDKVNKAYAQISFIEFLVSPMLVAACKVVAPLERFGDQMLQNAKGWHAHWLNYPKSPPEQDDIETMNKRITKLEDKWQG